MNIITLLGNVGQDPQSKEINGGVLISFSLACTKYKGKEESVTTWYKCQHWGNDDFIMKHIKKGAKVLVVGSLDKPKIYQKKDGTHDLDLTVNIDRVSFLPFKKEESQGMAQNNSNEQMDLPF